MTRFARSVPMLALCAGLAGCATIDRIMPDFGGGGNGGGSETPAEAAAPGGDSAAPAAGTSDAAGAAANGALTISEPAPAEASAAPPPPPPGSGWQRRVSPDIPYFNLGSNPVPTFADSDLTERTGALGRGEGGFVETCRDDAAVCRVATGEGGQAWVEITRLSGVAN